MDRKFTLNEWLAKAAERRKVSEASGVIIQRPKLSRQLGKSSVKRRVLNTLYGEYGQPPR